MKGWDIALWPQQLEYPGPAPTGRNKDWPILQKLQEFAIRYSQGPIVELVLLVPTAFARIETLVSKGGKTATSRYNRALVT